jgi:molybdenum cofactor cytidylyltransferase
VGAWRVVLGAKAEASRAQLSGLDSALFVVNSQWQSGQLSSIHAAIRSLPIDTTEGLMLCPVDHPIISSEVVAQIISAFDSSGKAIAIPTFGGRRGHPVIFRVSLYDELLAASPEVGARQVVWAHTDDVAEVPTSEQGVLLNLDDPGAYERAMRKI